jgi:hypothetical protein
MINSPISQDGRKVLILFSTLGFHPTEPKIFEGHLYGRGSGDDGYAAFAVIR